MKVLMTTDTVGGVWCYSLDLASYLIREHQVEIVLLSMGPALSKHQVDQLQKIKKLKNLHFTHYRFVQNKLPKDEIYEILSVMMSPLLNSTLEKVIWDIDVRQEDNMETMYQYMRHYGLRLVNEA
jgi:hypothetical protein